MNNRNLPAILRTRFQHHWAALKTYSQRPMVRFVALGLLAFAVLQKDFSFSISFGQPSMPAATAAATFVPSGYYSQPMPEATPARYIAPPADEPTAPTPAKKKTAPAAAAAAKPAALPSSTEKLWWENARDFSQTMPASPRPINAAPSSSAAHKSKPSNAPLDYLNLANPATAVSSALSDAEKQKAAALSNLGFLFGDKQAAPAAASARSQTVARYIATYLPIAQAEAREYNIPVSITLAQGLLESNAGDSKLASRDNNHFGIKCKSKCIGCRCANYTDDSRYDMFRIFSSAAESFREHSLLLTGERYKHLLLLPRTDYRNWAHGLKAAGYATDPKYGEKLINIIESLQLYRYDQ